MKAIRNILCATDFSDGAREAVDQALALAEALHAHVTLLHVYELPVYVFPDGSTFAASAEEMTKLSARVDAELEKARTEAEHACGEPIATESRMGRAADEIARAAREGDYDLVVLGTHGRTGL